MILPVFLLLRMPALVTSLTLFVSLMVLLTIAICKGWFRIPKKKTIITVWGVFAGLPVLSVLTLYFGNLMPAYQLARLKSIFTGSYDENSTAGILRSLFQNSKFSSSTESSALENLHGFNSEFVLAYLSAAYGLIIAALICCVLTVLLISIFSAVIKQKNQLGLLTGCGSAMIFLESFLVNILVNIGLLQVGNTFLPFFSAGGSFIIISYALLGVVLSIYRHKNIYPRHVNVSTIKIKSL